MSGVPGAFPPQQVRGMLVSILALSESLILITTFPKPKKLTKLELSMKTF
jgi:hypothetical protein